MQFGRLGFSFGRMDAGRSGVSHPSAPVLSILSSTGGLVSLNWDVDDTVAAGDTLRRQVQASGGDWSSPIDNTDHTISSGEDAANEITASLSLINGSYDIRGFVIKNGKVSHASNTLTITISDALNGALKWSADNLMWSTGHLIWS